MGSAAKAPEELSSSYMRILHGAESCLALLQEELQERERHEDRGRG